MFKESTCAFRAMILKDRPMISSQDAYHAYHEPDEFLPHTNFRTIQPQQPRASIKSKKIYNK
jgi:hypothetical protein